jgi:hypothetical protein
VLAARCVGIPRITRRFTVSAEIVTAALAAGGFAIVVAGGPSPNSVWIVGGASAAAMAIVARWREIAFSAAQND